MSSSVLAIKDTTIVKAEEVITAVNTNINTIDVKENTTQLDSTTTASKASQPTTTTTTATTATLTGSGTSSGGGSSSTSSIEQNQIQKIINGRRSSRRQRELSNHDPIIAPGFGTAKDIRRLAVQLSEGSDIVLTSEIVLSMMKSRGSSSSAAAAAGTRRSSRGQQQEQTTAESTTSAWADFMNEEGVDNSGTATSAAAAAASSTTSKDDNDKKRGQTDQDSSTSYGKKAKVTTTTAAKGTTATDEEDDDDLTSPKFGVLCQTGTLDSATVGRKKGTIENPPTYNLLQPTRLLPTKISIRSVHTSSNSCHSIAISKTNVVYGWGRNELNQLSMSLPVDVPVPTILSDLPRTSKFIAAATGKSHTLFLDTDGGVYSIGSNKCGQCGVKSTVDNINTYKKCIFQNANEIETDIVIKQIACGEDFSMALSSDGYLYSAGSGEFGQLGNGSTGEHIEKAGKLLFTNSNTFVRRTQFHHAPNEKLYTSGGSSKDKTEALPDNDTIRLQSIACGKHHTIAVEDVSNKHSRNIDDAHVPRVFSWGCGAYGCLGHGVQVDEYFPRLIGSLTNIMKATVNGSGASGNKKKSVLSVSAGASCSLLQVPNGHVYYWGKHRSIGEATMRPSLVDVLANNAHVVRHCDAGYQTVVVSTANAVTVAWGQGPYGELGFGVTAKSSAKPNFITSLDGCRVSSLACGYGSTIFVVRYDDDEDKAVVNKLPELNHNDCQPLHDAAEGKPKGTEAKASKK